MQPLKKTHELQRMKILLRKGTPASSSYEIARRIAEKIVHTVCSTRASVETLQSLISTAQERFGELKTERFCLFPQDFSDEQSLPASAIGCFAQRKIEYHI